MYGICRNENDEKCIYRYTFTCIQIQTHACKHSVTHFLFSYTPHIYNPNRIDGETRMKKNESHRQNREIAKIKEKKKKNENDSVDEKKGRICQCFFFIFQPCYSLLISVFRLVQRIVYIFICAFVAALAKILKHYT